MKAQYKVIIDSPEKHYVKVLFKGQRENSDRKLTLFMPSWSPGSYKVRDYARHIRNLQVTDSKGSFFYFTQVTKDSWEIQFNHKLSESKDKKFEVCYEIYCNDYTVRTSHVDQSHAFLHGPHLYMGIKEKNFSKIKVELDFPPMWTRVSTGLVDISKSRQKFLYEAQNFDELLDTPIEIGNQVTDGFMVKKSEHHLAIYGTILKNKNNIKKDIKKVCETVSGLFGEIPFKKYQFILQFAPQSYGGLEHANSSVNQFDGSLLNIRKEYVSFLTLISHEYFHAWNIKRIRPKELGPFNYLTENYTRMLWLAEGLTSFYDNLFVYRSGLITLEEYLDIITNDFNRYLANPGKKFDSLEDSSFNAWVKLYNPHENLINSTVSYYLKGGIVFFLLHILLREKGSSLDIVVQGLWGRYKKNKKDGVTKSEVLSLVKKAGGKEIYDLFDTWLSSTEELPWEEFIIKLGLKVKWKENQGAYLGIRPKFSGDRVLVQSVLLDSPASKSGLSADDEILFIDHVRIVKSNYDKLSEMLQVEKNYEVVVSRRGVMTKVKVIPEKSPRVIERLLVIDEENVQKTLNA